MISAATAEARTAYRGTRCWLRRRNSAQAGMPRSRENAYQVREQLVRPAAAQNGWPTVAISSTALAAAEVRAVSITGIEAPPFPLIAVALLAATIRASSKAQT